MNNPIKKIIRVGGVDVQQGLCSIAFNAIISIEGASMMNETAELTHSRLYKLLETATDVKEVNEGSTTRFVSFKQGIVEFEVYKRNN